MPDSNRQEKSAITYGPINNDIVCHRGNTILAGDRTTKTLDAPHLDRAIIAQS
jgi:hypothetical protein